ncbi:hypothetical protein K1516_12825 [Stenotrophomonas maltophilia]|uniref:toxin VasX n=1 Tax=Stenotrophomonas maltophilia TaxID=40324 RepID=UPI00200C8FB1|nr:toxin VasX [Stenotrophomonas maltophilia]ELF4098709.1 hypothetical protein [Stenotrophomonas maltophilia]UQA68836.1 hypothetical protein K1516_12825 [Stenotrophomonas maltophilia]WQI19321.1 toxin VasX [Stenotrophomonas maltophilia]
MTETGIVGAREKAKKKVSQTAGEKCPNCVKEGLAILPVTYTALPIGMRPMGPLASTLQGMSSELARGLTALDNGFSGEEEVKHHWYVMRALPAGFLYVLKVDGTWDAYEVNKLGLLRRFPVDLLPHEPGPEAACSRAEHNAHALQAIVIDPKKDEKVWIAYSRYRWTSSVLADYAQDKDGRRAKRMLELDVVAAASTQTLGAGSSIPCAMQLPDRLDGYVADYSSAVVRTRINEHLLEPLYERGLSGELMVLDAKSPFFIKSTMDRISHNVPRKTGILLVLPDAVGVTAQINHNRNRASALAADASGMVDPEKARRRVVSEMIEGIRASAEANPGPWWNKNYGPDRYLKHIDETKWREALAASEDFKRYIEQTKNIGVDFCIWKESANWDSQQRYDFDQGDHRSALDFESMVIQCVAGSGIDEEERKRVWEPVLDLPDSDPGNWFSKALAASDAVALKLMESAPPTFKDKLDSVGLAKSLAAEFLINKGTIESINRIRVSIRMQRAANQATATLIDTATGVMGRLQQSRPDQFAMLLRRITIAGLTRDDLVPAPEVYRTTWQRISQWMMEVATGPARIDPRAAAEVGRMVDGMEYMRTRGNFRQQGWALSEAVNGAVVFSEPNSSQEMAEVALWTVRRVQGGVHLDEVALRRLGLDGIETRVPTTLVPDNPLLRSHLSRIAVRADMMMSSAVLLFQATSIWGAAVEFHQGKNRAENGVKLFAAGLAAASAGLELNVAVRVLVHGATAVETKAITAFAAKISLYAGVIDGLFTIFQGTQKLRKGDADSGWWTIGSGVAAIAGTVAAYGFASAAIAGTAGGAATATILGVTMGPVGWLLIAVAALGLAVYMAIQAFGTSDEELSPVEYWLDNGVFGRRRQVAGEALEKNPFAKGGAAAAFADLQDEIYQFQRVTLVAVADFSPVANGNATLGIYEIALPRYAEGSLLQVIFYGFTEDGKKITVSSFDLQDGESKARNFKRSIRLTGGEGVPEVEVDGSGAAVIKGRLGSGRGMLVGVMNKVGRWFDENAERYTEVAGFGMKVSYFPDRNEIPDLSTNLEFPTSKGK